MVHAMCKKDHSKPHSLNVKVLKEKYPSTSITLIHSKNKSTQCYTQRISNFVTEAYSEETNIIFGIESIYLFVYATILPIFVSIE